MELLAKSLSAAAPCNRKTNCSHRKGSGSKYEDKTQSSEPVALIPFGSKPMRTNQLYQTETHCGSPSFPVFSLECSTRSPDGDRQLKDSPEVPIHCKKNRRILRLLDDKPLMPKVIGRRPTSKTDEYEGRSTPETPRAGQRRELRLGAEKAPGRQAALRTAYHASPRCW